MVWYSHLFQDFPQFIVIYTVKVFGIVSKAEIDVFLELSFSMTVSCFFYDSIYAQKQSVIETVSSFAGGSLSPH